MEVKSTTDSFTTHCLTKHLTSFAGGLVVLPNTINFQYVWSHASFSNNPIIFSCIIALTSLYLILAILIRILDLQDRKRLTLTALPSHSSHDNYFYEITTFTGMRPDAGSDSKVKNFMDLENNFSKKCCTFFLCT
jgi:hypothetical protein